MCSVPGMTQQSDVVSRFHAAAIFDGIRWAYGAASTRTLDDYSEEAGHDASWFGQTRYILFRDRLDRVFSCGRYALAATEADEQAGRDLVTVQLQQHEIDTMPSLAADLVHRADLHGSPGWVFGDARFLLASCAIGKIDSLPWPQRSYTKQEVASQPAPEPPPSLFDDMPEDEKPGLVHLLTAGKLDLDTFVVAHSLDAVSGRRELVFGRPQLNRGGGDAWHWYENLLTSPPSTPDQQPVPPASPSPDDVPDAPVKLRIQERDRKSKVAGK